MVSWVITVPDPIPDGEVISNEYSLTSQSLSILPVTVFSGTFSFNSLSSNK